VLPARSLAAPGLQEDRLLGQFVPKHFATLAAELPGRVESIPFREGERFTRGETLFTIDCDLQEAQRERARAELAAAEAAFQGNERLAALDAVGAVELAETEARVAVASADLAYLEVTLEKCRVAAPWDGAAGLWHVRPLEYVQPGQAVIDVHDPTALQVEFIVPTAWLSWFSPGYHFQIFVEELGRAVDLVLRGTAARADPVSQSVKAIADLINEDAALVAGMSGQLRVTLPGAHDAPEGAFP
jgi:RND family efflux transporter MFP subunit